MGIQSLHVEHMKADHCGERDQEFSIRLSSSSEQCLKEEKPMVLRLPAVGNQEQHGQKQPYAKASIPAAQQFPTLSTNFSFFGEASRPKGVLDNTCYH